MSERLPLIPVEAMTPAQRAVHDAIVSGPRAGIGGPFMAWLHSPQFADRAQSLGELVRFGTSISQRLKELGILMTARHWTAQFEWYAHEKLAREAGLEDAIIDAIRVGAPPPIADAAGRVVHQFTKELLDTRQVSDATFEEARETFGQAGVVELVGVLGYYTLVSMTLNVFEVEAPGPGLAHLDD